MPLARWKGLCLGATDPAAAAPFWSQVLDLQVERHDDDVTCLRGDPPERTTWVNRLRGPDDDIDWQVLADPEGNEFCVFSSD